MSKLEIFIIKKLLFKNSTFYYVGIDNLEYFPFKTYQCSNLGDEKIKTVMHLICNDNDARM